MKITYPANYLGAIVKNYGKPFDGLLVRLEGAVFPDEIPINEKLSVDVPVYNFMLGVIELPYDNTDNKLGLTGLNKKEIKQALEVWANASELKPVNKASKAFIKAVVKFYGIK